MLQQEWAMKLDELFLDTLKDIYFAERQILKALPKMTKAAQEPKLKEGFTAHREETQGQVERLQQVFEILGKRAQGKTCEAIQGIIEECEELLEEAPEPSTVRDAGLIACGQAVEHYEMARYGTLIAWAGVLHKKDVVALLQANLDQEKKADTLLTQIAGSVNPAAAKVG
jgi:ferritin-like metal-binding protein YciE